MSDSLRLHRFSGAAIHPWLPELARLRIQVFREFPYLYEGSAAYEEKYLKTYVDAPDSVMVVVCDGDRTVGASSGLPLEAETPNVIEPFLARGCDPSRIFYYGESVLLPEYRGGDWENGFSRSAKRTFVNWAISMSPASARWSVPPTIHAGRRVTCRWMRSGTGRGSSSIQNCAPRSRGEIWTRLRSR